MSTTPQPIYRADYRPPAFLISTVDLYFSITETSTVVRNTMTLRRNPEVEAASDLVLQGEGLQLMMLRLNDQDLAGDQYSLAEDGLTIFAVPDTFTLQCVTKIFPENNISLEGLYRSSGNYCTQCEAEGFRKITYYLDRPDVLAIFTTTIEADKGIPVLLANGNLEEEGTCGDGRHFARWHDPFPKPCYLFALVAGDLVAINDSFTTKSGREVALQIFVQAHNRYHCLHAMASLINAMRWDEEVFGLEYDLDLYMVVAVDDFNMGAMENKGLNIFNSKYVLADAATATDSDYEGIEGVIAHEYFHNWTGNRVTCRDWFQLSLKEGLTVFRDQEFSADMTNRALKRIHDVQLLRATQFIEDSGPMAHPIRPDSYIEINNFYTVTVYEKGAEVIRMIHTLLGHANFVRGMDLYFLLYDGQAVTCDDFVGAMATVAGRSLAQFKNWYRQAGTPELRVRGQFDADRQQYRLFFQQWCPPSPGQPSKEPFHIPVRLGLVGQESGEDVALSCQDRDIKDGVVELRQTEEELVFEQITEPVIPSLLRQFSAPVKLHYDYSDDELYFLLANDRDAFNRWEAGQRLYCRIILGLVADFRAGRPLLLADDFVEVIGGLLRDMVDPGLVAALLVLPAEKYLAEQMEIIDVEGIFAARQFMRLRLAEVLFASFLSAYHANELDVSYRYDSRQVMQRQLKNIALAYLMMRPTPKVMEMCLRQFEQADNMTDCLAAMQALAHGQNEAERKSVLVAFYSHWQQNALVLDKWFAVQATAPHESTLDEVKKLLRHPNFSMKNPNKVRALIGAFCAGNQICFHAASGAGYRFLADRVLELNEFNPQIGARLLAPLSRWHRFDVARQELMRAELERILTGENLAKDIYEIASKSLAVSTPGTPPCP